jgi:hypothetical protein
MGDASRERRYLGGMSEERTEPAARRGGWRTLVHWFGMACLMVAAGFAGYIGWSLWGTGLHTAAAQEHLRSEFREQIEESPADPSTAPAPATRT